MRWGCLALMAVLPACAGDRIAAGGPEEMIFRGQAPFLAAPPEETDPLVSIGGAADTDVAVVVHTPFDPGTYADYRLRQSALPFAVRVSRVLDDVERAVARLAPASYEAERIAQADRARLAVLSQALGEGRRLETEKAILARARANRAALDTAAIRARAWGTAFRAAADDILSLEPGSERGGTLSDGLARFDTALRRLERARNGLVAALDGLPAPADPAPLP